MPGTLQSSYIPKSMLLIIALAISISSLCKSSVTVDAFTITTRSTTLSTSNHATLARKQQQSAFYTPSTIHHDDLFFRNIHRNRRNVKLNGLVGDPTITESLITNFNNLNNLNDLNNNINNINNINNMNTLVISESAEGWKQYVPLVVSCGVILDILLGSPLANLALAPMRRASEQAQEGGGGGGDDTGSNTDNGNAMNMIQGLTSSSSSNKFNKNPRERVDTETIGQEALDKARYAVELRKFLDENKTDKDRYEDMKKKIDASIEDFDANK